MKRILQISNSTLYGQNYLDHCADSILEFLGETRTLLFVPYAGHDRDGYAGRVTERFEPMRVKVSSVHRAADPARAVREAEAIFVGGGNTFRLLSSLYEERLLEPIRHRVAEGMPYVGSSAGSNVACPTIRTTNDMPIVQPPSFDALGLVPFNINAHYLDPDPDSKHMGETREERIREFHEVNEEPVVGLREGAWLRTEGDRVTLGGSKGARLFRRGADPEEFTPGADLSFLLDRNRW
jgi:dipeptidase E